MRAHPLPAASTSGRGEPAGQRPACVWRAAPGSGRPDGVSWKASKGQRAGALAHGHALLAAAVEEEEDLVQYKDRDKWYLPKFAADDAPDWNPAQLVEVKQQAPGLREVILKAEVSREHIPIRNAYKHVGQRAQVRVKSGANAELTVACPPFPLALQKTALFKTKGDVFAGEIKVVRELTSVQADLSLLVSEKEAPDVYNIQDDDGVELGPFVGAGLDLRGPIFGIYNYPTIVIFAEGRGIANARALIEAGPEERGLSFELRQDVRVYYRAPNQEALCFKELFGEWEARYFCKVVTSTRGTFQDMFDDDDTLAYEPATTAAVILTGGDDEAETAALEVCKEAEISVIVKDSEEQIKTEYVTPKSRV